MNKFWAGVVICFIIVGGLLGYYLLTRPPDTSGVYHLQFTARLDSAVIAQTGSYSFSNVFTFSNGVVLPLDGMYAPIANNQWQIGGCYEVYQNNQSYSSSWYLFTPTTTGC
jgi:hypothetical protein